MAYDIEDFPLFRNVKPETRAALEKHLEFIEFENGDMVYEYGDAARHAFFIYKGAVKAMNYGPQGHLVYLVKWGAGKFFGHTAALTELERTENMIAVGKLVVATLKADKFHELFTHDPVLADELIMHMAHDLREKIQVLTSRTALTAKEIVAYDLVRRCNFQDATEVEIPDRKEWAAFLGLTRETLSRVLSELTKQGAIDVTKNAVDVYDLDTLQDMAKM